MSGGSTLSASVIGVDLSALPILYNGLTVAEGNIPLTGDITAAAVGWSIANPVSGTPIGIHQMVEMTLTLLSFGPGPSDFVISSIVDPLRYNVAPIEHETESKSIILSRFCRLNVV